MTELGKLSDGRSWGVICGRELKEMIDSGVFRDGTRADRKIAKNVLAAIQVKELTRAEKYIEDVYGEDAMRLAPITQITRSGVAHIK
jgi:hypothetical protein